MILNCYYLKQKVFGKLYSTLYTQFGILFSKKYYRFETLYFISIQVYIPNAFQKNFIQVCNIIIHFNPSYNFKFLKTEHFFVYCLKQEVFYTY